MDDPVHEIRRATDRPLPMRGIGIACAADLPGAAVALMVWSAGAGWPWIPGLRFALSAAGLAILAAPGPSYPPSIARSAQTKVIPHA